MTLRPGSAPIVEIAAGALFQGDDHHYPEERPTRLVAVDAFAIDVHPVTNAQFASFVDATGHVTRAESSGSAVFVSTTGPVDLARPELWWRHEPHASWCWPDGQTALTAEQFDHPVVHVDRHDAATYAAWVGGRLPTEPEWEWASSGGVALPAEWPLAADGMLLANVWLGEFPWHHARVSAPGTAPVGCFPPNVNGLFDMLGNVWEWTSDSWARDADASPVCCAPADGTGIVKGGSFLCAANYCSRYRPAARHRQPVDGSASHIGFRCAYDVGTPSREGAHDG